MQTSTTRNNISSMAMIMMPVSYAINQSEYTWYDYYNSKTKEY